MKKSILYLLVLAFSLRALPSQAEVFVTSANSSWQHANAINVSEEPTVFFGSLGRTGDARYYKLKTDAPQVLAIQLAVPVGSHPQFQPQLVVFKPEPTTIGPVLPLLQPPNTIALVYPASEHERQYERLTQISLVNRLQASVDLPAAGTYYLAVYNADRQPGRFRLSLEDPAKTGSMSVWGWPKRWWLSHVWAGNSGLTLTLPLLTLGTMLVIVWGASRWRVLSSSRRKRT